MVAPCGLVQLAENIPPVKRKYFLVVSRPPGQLFDHLDALQLMLLILTICNRIISLLTFQISNKSAIGLVV